jgi:hypothetical protein
VHEPVVLKATGDCVESGGVLEAKLFARLSESDPGLIDDQGKELVTTTTRGGRGCGGARAGRGCGGRASARFAVAVFSSGERAARAVGRARGRDALGLRRCFGS